MEQADASVPLALIAGILSFISPCVLPLVPAYIGYLSGRALGPDRPSRVTTFLHALAFVLGFTLVFTVIFGVSAGLLGAAFQDYLDIARQVGGVVVIVLGLHMLGVIHLSFLDYERRLGQTSTPTPGSYATSLVVGVSFAAGWTPCVGPILGAIFALALNEGEAFQAVLLFFVYSLGLGIPFLLTALALDSITARLKALNRYMGVIERLSGLLLIAVGVLLLINGLPMMARFFRWAPPL